MADPVALMSVALADRLHMLPSEFRRKATHWDIVQLAALDRTRDETWRKRYERDRQVEESRTLSDEEKAARLFRGF